MHESEVIDRSADVTYVTRQNTGRRFYLLFFLCPTHVPTDLTYLPEFETMDIRGFYQSFIKVLSGSSKCKLSVSYGFRDQNEPYKSRQIRGETDWWPGMSNGLEKSRTHRKVGFCTGGLKLVCADILDQSSRTVAVAVNGWLVAGGGEEVRRGC